MSPGEHGDDAQPSWLPDFVDPRDVDERSLDASISWGQESSPAADEAAASRESRGAASRSGRVRGSSFTSATESSKGLGTKKSRAKKKHLTWAQKQERREARAEKRREEEAAERARDPMGFAREIVLTHLAAAPRSRAQLAQKLRDKEVDEDVIDAVLDRMEDVGLVDDAAYAGMLVRSQVATRGLARRALARELQRRGIEQEQAQAALEQVDDDAERSRALELARKKLATMSRLSPDVRTRRLAGLLARKGYPPALVWSVVKEVQGSADQPGEF